jgi:hypothetical protein
LLANVLLLLRWHPHCGGHNITQLDLLQAGRPLMCVAHAAAGALLKTRCARNTAGGVSLPTKLLSYLAWYLMVRASTCCKPDCWRRYYLRRACPGSRHRLPAGLSVQTSCSCQVPSEAGLVHTLMAAAAVCTSRPLGQRARNG